MKKNILILAAHPDDEVFSCVGTVAKLIKKIGTHIFYFLQMEFLHEKTKKI